MSIIVHLKLNTTIRLFFKILDCEISFEVYKFIVYFYSLSKLSNRQFVILFLCFGTLIMCGSKTCVFVLIRFSMGRLEFFAFMQFYFG